MFSDLLSGFHVSGQIGEQVLQPFEFVVEHFRKRLQYLLTDLVFMGLPQLLMPLALRPFQETFHLLALLLPPPSLSFFFAEVRHVS